MAKHRCEHCKMRARYDADPGSLLGRIWRWHIRFCPGWRSFIKGLDPEARAEMERQYSLRMRSVVSLLLIVLLVLFMGWCTEETAYSSEPSTITEPTTGMEFVLVKGGSYQMGDTFGDGSADEKPVHEVCVDDFYIGKYVVTQGQWRAVMGNNPSKFRDCGDNCPVEMVSWDNAQEFISRLNSRSGGNRYRLPTEAEWEYAARSGGKKEKYSGGNDIDRFAWYYRNSGDKTHPVGTKAPNGLGLYDMNGNVWQWVNDWYGEGYYSESPRNNPHGPGSGHDRVLRGSSWAGGPALVRAASRGKVSPSAIVGGGDSFGFRVALSSR